MDVNKQIDWAIQQVVQGRLALAGFAELTDRDKALLEALQVHLGLLVEPREFVIIRDGELESSSSAVEHIDMDDVNQMGPEEAFEFYIHLQDLGLPQEAAEVKEIHGYDWSEWGNE